MSGNKGRKVAIILSLFLFLAGSAVTLSPWLHSLWVNYTMRRNVQEFLSYVEVAPYAPGQTSLRGTTEKGGETGRSFLPTEYTQLWLDMQSYNQVIFEEGQTGLSDPSAYEKASVCLADYGLESEVFGVLSIPRLEMEMPIYLGASKQNMANGAAVMGQTSLPIGGSDTNCVLAGHRGWNGAAYFLYINQLERGDVVTVTNLWETLTYEVVDTQIISPNDVDAIHIQPNRELLTLLTCHPPASGGKQRYLVFCERVYEMEDYE
ncbi:MAG: class C sortase [Candidatus Limivicinus sp.]